MLPWVQSTLNPKKFRRRISTEKKPSKNPLTQPMHMSLAVHERNGNYSQQRRDFEKVAPYEPSWLQFRFILPHYSDVTLSLMASQITSFSIVCSTVFFWRISKKIFKDPRHRILWGKATTDWWIPLTKCQQRGKFFHMNTSSWRNPVKVSSVTNIVGIPSNVEYAVPVDDVNLHQKNSLH